MTLSMLARELQVRTQNIRVTVPEQSLLFGPAREIEAMVLAYESDGGNFESNGDSINALASYAYALGWLDAGCCIGLLVAGEPALTRVLPGSSGEDTGDERLCEKTKRYQALLERACHSVDAVPDTGSRLFEGSQRIQMIGRVYLLFGELAIKDIQYQCALSCFSYGFGWLDAGIRAGFLTATSHRNIFTL